MKPNSTWKIIARNTLTLFNLVNLILAIMVALVGSYKNMLFIFVAIANTLIGIVNEVRAKKIVDKLKLLSEQRPKLLKNGQIIEVPLGSIQPGDLLVLSLGDQVIFDGVIEDGSCEANESFITGEQDSIVKRKGDHLTSGSFLTSGSVTAKVLRVGADNFVTKLQTESQAIKTADSKLFTLMNNIVKYISYTLIPIGALLFWARFRTEADTATAVTSTVAALINMIPEGLILLTSSVLALATIRLSKKKVLVQDLYAIETLARVDTIALDKTGTLTTGRMTVHDIVLPDGTATTDYTTPELKSLLSPLAAILSSQTSENATISALRQTFLKSAKFRPTSEFAKITEVIPFSSDRKHSGIVTKDATYLMGAIEFIADDKALIKKVKSASSGYRTLAVVRCEECPHSRSMFGDGPETGALCSAGHEDRPERPWSVPEGHAAPVSGPSPVHAVELLGLIRLEDEIRPTAKKIVNYFYDNDIAIRIISGDDLAAVTEIATKVGVKDLKGIDLSTLKSKNYAKLVKDYQIFTRVTPAEKKDLIIALKKQGNTVAMTGDGVNDILAMKEADVSLAIGEGSDAARRAAKFVLLDSGFEAVPSIIDEGRQSINNLERSTSLFLAKTVYASILAVVFVFLPFSYPFKPIEMTLLNFACIGFPGLVLSLEKNTDRIKNRFVTNILTYSLPIGLTVSLCMIALAIIAGVNNFPHYELSTAAVFITFVIDFVLIYWVSKPLNKLRGALLVTIITIMAIIFLWPFTRDFFEFTFLSHHGLIISLSIIAAGVVVFGILRRQLARFTPHLLKRSSKKH